MTVDRHGHRDGDRVRASVALLEHACRGLRGGDVIYGEDADAADTAMTAGDVMKLLAAQLRRLDRAEVPTAEKTRLTGPLANSLLTAIATHVLEEQIEALTFMELVEDAAKFTEALEVAQTDNDVAGVNDGGEGVSGPTIEDGEPGHDSTERVQEDAEAEDFPVHWRRSLDLVLATGFILRTKAEGWKRFCERLSVPPLLLWEVFPGLPRLWRALAAADITAFTPEGFLRWVNHVRPKGEPEQVTLSFSAETVADANEQAFQERAKWWSS